MRKLAIVVFSVFALHLLFSIALSEPAYAITVFACNSTGHQKDTFYTNESVYVSGNLTGPGASMDIYIVSHRTSWPNGTALPPLSLGYTIFTANASGGLPASMFWSTPTAGSYDIVADVDRNGIYNTTYDTVDNVTVAGFTVIESPKPTLAVVLGKYHPASHDIDLETEGEYNVMMQINMSASTKEDIVIYSVAITALGTGDDKKDVKVVYLIYDNNDDGKYNSGDVILGYSSYARDNGAAFLSITDGFEITSGKSRAFIITYTMSKSGSIDDTYRFDLITVTASGKASGETAVINGLPVGSAIKTVSNEASVTTTSSAENGTTTSTIPKDECQIDTDCQGFSCSEKQKTLYKCVNDTIRDVKICEALKTDIECCGDADCVEGFYCMDYDCIQEKAGGAAEWLRNIGSAIEGENTNYVWAILSIVVVSIAAIAVFLIIKNRRREPWRATSGPEKNWEELRRKWE